MPADAPPWALYADGVRLIALRATGDESTAADIAQEAITRAMIAWTGRASREGADAIGDLRAFVYGIARHLVADVHRERGRTRAIDDVPDPVEPAADALAAAVAAEDRRRLRAALGELSWRDRVILRLCYFDALDVEEIARRLGDNPVNVRKRKSRALERLRRVFLQRHEGEGEPTDT